MNIRTKLFISLLTMVLFVLLIGYITLANLSEIKRLVDTNSENIDINLLNSEQLKQDAMDIQYYDEVLTQSARNYAYTGDIKWKTRYLDAEPTLEATIKNALKLSDENERRIFSAMDEANVALGAIEHKSLDYVDSGMRQEAIDILDGAEYSTQKGIYSNGVSNFISYSATKHSDSINKIADTVYENLNEIESRIDVIVGYILLTLAASLSVTVVLTIYLQKQVAGPLHSLGDASKKIAAGDFNITLDTRKKDELGELNVAFKSMADKLGAYQEEIEQANKNLELKVQERTTELNDKVEDLDRTRIAIINIMEDLQRNKMELEEKVKTRTLDLQKAYDELRESDRVKDDFLAITSHELKTPLTSIIGLTHLIQEELADKMSDDEKEDIKIVMEEANRLRKLIEEILELARLDAGKKVFTMTDVDLKVVANEVAEELKPFSQQFNVPIRVEPFDVPTITGDTDSIKTLMNNLINNAIKYMSGRPGEVTVGARLDGKNVVTYVKDIGIGIPDMSKGKIFARFYQVDSSKSRKYGGTGLGLAICKKIVEAHNGSIWFESRGGVGSTFYFSLPISKKDATKPAREGA
ncbi:MAG: ATP-binding protein [Candidatus Altiarchaeota archaeon]